MEVKRLKVIENGQLTYNLDLSEKVFIYRGKVGMVCNIPAVVNGKEQVLEITSIKGFELSSCQIHLSFGGLFIRFNTKGILASMCLENYVPYGHVTKVYNINKDNNVQIETDKGTYDINETLSVKFMLDTIEYDRFIHLDANSTLKLFSESSKCGFPALMWEVENW